MPRREVRWAAVLAAGLMVGGVLAVAAASSGRDSNSLASKSTDSVVDDSPTVASVVDRVVAAKVLAAPLPTPGVIPESVPSTDDIAVADPTEDGCVLAVQKLAVGDSGPDVVCLQTALTATGLYSGKPSGQFDMATDTAVRVLQQDRALFVDGVVGRESAISLGIWPDEQSLVVHTPPPSPGAVDLLGYPLSSVATSGADAPPVPANSGSGRRIVYQRAGQRIWAIDKDGAVIRSYLVTGSKYSNETPGTHEVYSRSDVSTAWNGKAWLPKMVRWLKTDIGAIGFHAIPKHVEDDSPYQTEAELGTRMSGGCQRQANLDADFMWDFGQLGTPVVVV